MNNNENKLSPVNNKSLFHSLSDVFGQVMRGEMKDQTANTLCNVAARMQKSLELEQSRFKIMNLVGGKSVKFREIETKMLDDNQIELSESTNKENFQSLGQEALKIAEHESA